jgi:serine protease Do
MKKISVVLLVLIAGIIGGLGGGWSITRWGGPQRIIYTDAKPLQVAATDPVSSSRKNAIVLAAHKVGPAVVSINVIQTRIVRETPFASPFGDEFFGDPFWKDFFPSRTYKEQLRSLGSGVLINKEGIVLTNEHVVRGAETIKVTLPDGRKFDGKLLGTDPQTDLAVVKIAGSSLPAAILGNSDDLAIGEWAIAIGNPFAYLLEDTQPTVTAGVVSATHRSIKSERGQVQVYRDMIQTDAAINPGNSGGPLVNADGEVIGVNTFIFTASGGSEGIGFAIPINRAKRVMEDLLQHGEVKRMDLGILVQNLSPDLVLALKLKDSRGVVVADVTPGSLADQAGIEPGDVIRKVNGAPVTRTAEWDDRTRDLRLGEKAILAIEREGKVYPLALGGKEKLPSGRAAGGPSPLGLTVKANGSSLVVVAVEPGSLAQRMGVQKGDVVKQVDGQPVKSPEEFSRLVAKAKAQGAVSLALGRGGIALVLSFPLGEG